MYRIRFIVGNRDDYTIESIHEDTLHLDLLTTIQMIAKGKRPICVVDTVKNAVINLGLADGDIEGHYLY